MAASEQPLFLPGGDYRLFAMLHRPDAACGRGFVLCAPFAEEKKGAHRLLVDLARALCRRGVTVLRFDYRGTGDSEGSFTDFTLSGAIEDTRLALDTLRAQAPAAEVGLLGVRLGATLAAHAAQASGVGQLALWEPVANGKRYMQMNLRQKRIREMMTAAEGEAAGAAASTGTEPPQAAASPDEGYDFDGYWITPALHREIEALTIPKPTAGDAPARVLGVSVNAAGRVSAELNSVGAPYTAAGAEVALQAVTAEPFWSLQDPVPVPELIRVTADWIAAPPAEEPAP